MEKTVVSVILTCYNQAPYLAEALESVLNQTYPHWECIILNDGSTDRSEEIALQYVAKDKRFVYVCQENQGVVAARNHAISASHGTYILPLDGDDKIAPSYLEQAVEVLDQDQQVILVCCGVEKFGDETGPFVLPEMTIRNLLRGGCCVSCSMYRRASYDAAGGYKQEMSRGWEDWEFFISLLETGGKAYRLPQTLFFYRILHRSRNSGIADPHKEALRQQIVRLHPDLYFLEYGKLLDEHDVIVQTWAYKLLAPVYTFLRSLYYKFK